MCMFFFYSFLYNSVWVFFFVFSGWISCQRNVPPVFCQHWVALWINEWIWKLRNCSVCRSHPVWCCLDWSEWQAWCWHPWCWTPYCSGWGLLLCCQWGLKGAAVPDLPAQNLDNCLRPLALKSKVFSLRMFLGKLQHQTVGSVSHLVVLRLLSRFSTVTSMFQWPSKTALRFLVHVPQPHDL